MEGAPKIPPTESKKKLPEAANKAANLIGVVVGSAIAAASPINKVTTPTEGAPKPELTLQARAQDYEPIVLKQEIDGKILIKVDEKDIHKGDVQSKK
jgi:hypothetical protein